MIEFDRNFFKEINTAEKAYILGFFYADGNNSGTQIRFDQIVQDIDIIEKIKKCMNAQNNIKYVKIDKENHWDQVRLTFSSREMCKDVEKLGGIKHKSLVLEFPSFDIVPEKYMSHFIRGYFDGDGCIWNGKRKKMIVKDSTRKEGYRERIVHNVKFTIAGTVQFIDKLQDYLVLTLGFRKTKLNMRKKTEHRSDKICTMEYSGRRQIKKFFDFIYKDSTIHMDRKYNKFLEILCASKEKSLEDTSLIAGTPEMEISSQTSNLEEGSSTIPEMGVHSSEWKCEALNT